MRCPIGRLEVVEHELARMHGRPRDPNVKSEVTYRRDPTALTGPPMPHAEPVFVECPTCSAKPGSPDLCADCLRRRSILWAPRIDDKAEHLELEVRQRENALGKALLERDLARASLEELCKLSRAFIIDAQDASAENPMSAEAWGPFVRAVHRLEHEVRKNARGQR